MQYALWHTIRRACQSPTDAPTVNFAGTHSKLVCCRRGGCRCKRISKTSLRTDCSHDGSTRMRAIRDHSSIRDGSFRPAAKGLIGIGLAVVGAALAGCSGFNVDRGFSWSKSGSSKPQPAQLTVVWTQGTQKRSEKHIIRGFRGRIQFFAKDSNKDSDNEPGQPIRVEGMLTVYAFDESAAGKNGSGPPKKFVFIDKKFKTLYHDSKEGGMYVIWLPWDEVGGPPKKVRLMVRFDAADNGPALMSQDSQQVLHVNPDNPRADAKYAKKSPPKRTSPGDITQTGFESPAPTEDRKTRDPKPSERAASGAMPEWASGDGPK